MRMRAYNDVGAAVYILFGKVSLIIYGSGLALFAPMDINNYNIGAFLCFRYLG